jgi:hypothetical protein
VLKSCQKAKNQNATQTKSTSQERE